MGWFKVDDHLLSHPAGLKVGDSALGLWLRVGCWLATFPKQDDFIPAHMAKRFGTKRQVARLVESHLWSEVEGGYAMRRTMNICGSGLTGSFWDIERKDRRANIPDRLRQAIYTRDGYACVDCGSDEDLSLDHIHPWSRGGADTFENLRTLCRSCNSRKGARV